MKNGGRIPWSVTAVCRTYKISYLMGRQPFKGPKIPSGAMVSAKDLSRLHQFARKCYHGVLRLCIVRRDNLERRHIGRRH